jgi:hypothetical protein
MSNKPRICIELFHRDEISLDQSNWDRLGWAIFHWAILVRPKDIKQIKKSVSFDVTDGIKLDSVNRRNLNPSGDWYFRARNNVNPLDSGHFLGAIEVAKLPKNVTIEELHSFMSQLPLPEKNQDPEQNCVTWVYEALKALGRAGYVPEQDAQEVMNKAMALAREVMAKGRPRRDADCFRPL